MNRRSEYDTPSLRQYAITSTLPLKEIVHEEILLPEKKCHRVRSGLDAPQSVLAEHNKRSLVIPRLQHCLQSSLRNIMDGQRASIYLLPWLALVHAFHYLYAPRVAIFWDRG